MRRIARNAIGRIRRSFSRRQNPARVLPAPPPPRPPRPPPPLPSEFREELRNALLHVSQRGRAYWFDERIDHPYIPERWLNDYYNSDYTSILEWANNYYINPNAIARMERVAQQQQDEYDADRVRYTETIGFALAEEESRREEERLAKAKASGEDDETEVREGLFDDVVERERMQEEEDEQRENAETEEREWYPGM